MMLSGQLDAMRSPLSESSPVMAAVGAHRLDARDLGDRMPFVSILQKPSQPRIFLDRLRPELGIDAQGAKEQLLLMTWPWSFIRAELESSLLIPLLLGVEQ